MTTTTTQQWTLAKKPTSLPVLTGPDATFELCSKQLGPLPHGEVSLKVLYLSNDPAQRLWIDPNINADRLYRVPVAVGDKMDSYAIGQVVESNSPNLPIGSLVTAPTGWCEFAQLPAEECVPLESVKGLSIGECVALFGVASVTAYYGLVDITKTTAQDAIVISGAAGAVGSIAVQIAKHILGCRKVIGVAGSDDKCTFVESLGADICLNYKSVTFEEDLRGATEGFVEVFFDNVGGSILNLMLTRLKKHGRVAACGAISEYNRNIQGITNWYDVVAMRLQLFGFVVLDALPTGRWQAIVQKLIEGYEGGKIKASEGMVMVVNADFEDIPKIWSTLFASKSSGKLLTQIAQAEN